MRRFNQSLKVSTFLTLSAITTAAYGHCGHEGCTSDAFPDGETSPTGNIVIPAFSVAANGMPILNSNAGAMGAAYLDFDGGMWQGNGGNPYAAYDTDGDSTTFNASEQADIYKAWLDTATHYAMFDINVTTVAPDKTLTPTAHLLISNDQTGGSANSNTFGNTTTNAHGAVASSFARNRSTGITHEFGHMLGARHQADFDENGNYIRAYAIADEFDRGYMMGRDFEGKFAAWRDGDKRISDGAGGFLPAPQNDIDAISGMILQEYDTFSGGTYAGDGFREDDHGSGSYNSSTRISRNPSDLLVEGIIERYDDEDWIGFIWDGGDFHAFVEADRNAAANPEFASSLGMNFELYNKKGKLIASDLSADPADVDAEILVSNLKQARYTLRVSSAGDVEDLGTYNLWVNPTPPAAPLEFAAVPEPTSLALLGLGGLLLGTRRRRG